MLDSSGVPPIRLYLLEIQRIINIDHDYVLFYAIFYSYDIHTLYYL